MALKDALLPEFDHEMAVTRRVLERVPWQDVDWKPHPKSMSLGALSSHLTSVLEWALIILKDSGFNLTEPPRTDVPYQSVEELLAGFDKNVRAVRDLIANMSDAQFLEPWTFKDKGKEVFTMPRIGTLRNFTLNHTIHHRGQLSVYLRLRNVPVPAMYGPTADER
jgi:uncharacterized damage-inducible protein DinB